ncbi:MAG: hypothetical protein HZA46_06775 [Planctomycetales bacterium]|nr:hypothetical protein [Planctomycetales bacterium]
MAAAFRLTSTDIVPQMPRENANSFFYFLAGLTSVADWIGSNQDFFKPVGCNTNLEGYVEHSRCQAVLALKELGWLDWQPQQVDAASFGELFPLIASPRPLQTLCVSDIRDESKGRVVAQDWFGQNKKQGLLAPFAVGTIDSAGKAGVPQVQLIKPDGFSIDVGAFDLHGISTQFARDKGVALRPVLDSFIDAVNTSDTVIAHNVEFDANIVGAECVRAGLSNPIRRKRLRCTMKESTNYCRLHEVFFSFTRTQGHFMIHRWRFPSSHSHFYISKNTRKNGPRVFSQQDKTFAGHAPRGDQP